METPITLVELPPWQHGILNGQPSYDEFSLVMSRLHPRALPTLEAVARDRGYRNVQSISPICNPSSRLTQSDWQRLLSSEVVGLSAITRTSKQTLELARILKLNSPRTKIVVGGPHFTVRYEDALDRYRCSSPKRRRKNFSRFIRLKIQSR